MPILLDRKIRVLNQSEFHELNHHVLGLVFEVHNEFGRLIEESVFKKIVAARWELKGRG